MFVEVRGQRSCRCRDKAENREGHQGRNCGLHGTFTGVARMGLQAGCDARLAGTAANPSLQRAERSKEYEA
jgi:hypothetical protein